MNLNLDKPTRNDPSPLRLKNCISFLSSDFTFSHFSVITVVDDDDDGDGVVVVVVTVAY